jgi:hypothetical protein
MRISAPRYRRNQWDQMVKDGFGHLSNWSDNLKDGDQGYEPREAGMKKKIHGGRGTMRGIS